MSSLDQTNTVNNSNAIQDDWDDNALHNQNLKDIDLDDMDEDILDFGGEPDADDFFANSGNVDNADEESVDTDDLSFDDNVDVNTLFHSIYTNFVYKDSDFHTCYNVIRQVFMFFCSFDTQHLSI